MSDLEKAKEDPDVKWIPLDVAIKLPENLTFSQELAIRDYAFEEFGMTDLRGFHMKLRQTKEDYYDILQAMSP